MAGKLYVAFVTVLLFVYWILEWARPEQVGPVQDHVITLLLPLQNIIESQTILEMTILASVYQ